MERRPLASRTCRQPSRQTGTGDHGGFPSSSERRRRRNSPGCGPPRHTVSSRRPTGRPGGRERTMRQSMAATPAAQVLLYGACLVLVAAGMQAAANLVSALVLSIVLATVLAPVLGRLRTAGGAGRPAGLPGRVPGVGPRIPVVRV